MTPVRRGVAAMTRASQFPSAPRLAEVLTFAGACATALLGAMAVGSGKGTVAIGLAAIPVGLFVLPRLWRASGLATGYFSIELPLGLLLLSTVVLRVRDAESLSDNPLDSAAMYRLACVGMAGLLGWITVLRAPASAQRFPIPGSLFVYATYVAVTFLGAPLSQDLPLTAYRCVELATGVFVVFAAVGYGGRDAILRIERLLYGFVIFIVASVWAAVILVPGRAILHSTDTPVPLQLQGVFPTISSNGVGGIAAILVLWALGRRLSGESTDRWNLALIVMGVLTLLGAQYRTGYFALAITILFLLVVKGRTTLALLAAVAVAATGLWSASAITRTAEPYVLRGQSTEQARQLSGRLDFWKRSIPVWRESPIFGKGLLTATRFEVLAPLGLTTVSTIHSTWVEALVGTGVVGVASLGVYFLLLWRAALFDFFARGGLVYPALLVVFVTVSSITGSTIEVFGFLSLVFLMLPYRLSLSIRERTQSGERRGA